MILDSDFNEATRLFHEGLYNQGIQRINKYILTNPVHSMLYSNRALFHFQMKNNQHALRDLQTAIQINYLNYIAYFNLFSIELRIGGLEREAFQDLCCSLSILYFLRAKAKKFELDVQKSLKYCQNNIEAHILKGMMHLESNKLKLAKNEIEWALQFQPDNIVLKRLQYFIRSKVGQLYEQEQNNENPFETRQKYKPQKRNRLECSIQIQQQEDIQQCIRQKLQQFTQVYNDLNCQTGTITQRILIENDNTILQTSIISQISGIYYEGNKRDITLMQSQQINDKRKNKFIKKLQIQRQAQEQFQRKEQNQQQNIVIYDQIILKDFDPQTQQQQLQNQVEQQTSIKEYQTYKQNIIDQQQIVDTDYFIMNEREEFLTGSQQKMEQSVEIPYEILNKKFLKKEEQTNDQKIVNQSNNQIKQFIQRENCQQNTNDEKESNFIQLPITHQNIQTTQISLTLPQPKQIQNIQSNNVVQISTFQLLQTNNNQTFQNFVQKKSQNLLQESQFQEKPFIQLEQTGNTGNYTDQYSDAILSYSSETKILQNYGKLLSKGNNNLKFYESQVMQNQQNHQLNDQQYNINNGNNDENTFIDDLISQSSHKNKESVNNSASFSKKKSTQNNQQQAEGRIVKSLNNSIKNFNKKIQIQVKKECQNQQKETKLEKKQQKFQIMQLYPFALPKKQIFFIFTNIQFSKKYKVSALDQVYLVGIYHLSIPKYKMKTQSHRLQGTLCNWNERFAEMNLLQQVQNLKIKVFNKTKGANKRDELLGEAQKAVCQSGEVRLALHEKKILIGYVKYAIWVC